MTDEEAIELLKQGKVEEWNAFIQKTDKTEKERDSLTNLLSHKLNKIVLDDLDLTGVRLTGGNLSHASLRRTILTSAELEDCVFNHANLANARLDDADLYYSTFIESNLIGTNFEGSNLRNADFADACADNANFLNVHVNAATNFRPAAFNEVRIEKYILEALSSTKRPDPAEINEMDVYHDVAKMRRSFSGFYWWIHMTAILFWLFPYAWFLYSIYPQAKFTPEENQNTITLFEALLRFIYNGGQNWQSGWYLVKIPFAAFCFSFYYNCSRIAMLFKTKQLEQREATSGQPVRFLLSRHKVWNTFWEITEIGFYLNVIVVLIHTYYFLSQRIPV